MPPFLAAAFPTLPGTSGDTAGGSRPAGRGGPPGGRTPPAAPPPPSPGLHPVSPGFASGVIVGSAFVSRLLGAEDASTGIAAVRDLASDLAAGVRDRSAAS